MFTIQLTEEQIAAIQVRESLPKSPMQKTPMREPQEVVEYLRHMGLLEKEHFLMVTLNSRDCVINKHVVSVGTADATLIHPREVFRLAILDNAIRVVIAHNHPSGNTEPSEDDLIVTKRLQTAGKILGIQIVDHLVIGAEGYHSMHNNGQLKL